MICFKVNPIAVQVMFQSYAERCNFDDEQWGALVANLIVEGSDANIQYKRKRDKPPAPPSQTDGTGNKLGGKEITASALIASFSATKEDKAGTSEAKSSLTQKTDRGPTKDAFDLDVLFGSHEVDETVPAVAGENDPFADIGDLL
jgi:hypothetical protein